MKVKRLLWGMAICCMTVMMPGMAVDAEYKKAELTTEDTLAATYQYKEMDYGFLKDYSFGKQNPEITKINFATALELAESEDSRLREGKYVRTQGYFLSNDGGAALYQICKESQPGAVKLSNGLYACIIPESYTDSQGKQWLIVNVKQFGAAGDGENTDNPGLNAAIAFAGIKTAESEECERGIVYIPSGEYKCTDQMFADTQNLNIVGEGESTILFTDNDYRKESGYSEHFFQVWNAKNMFFGKFRIEAREVDLYHYMRQFTLLDCEDITVYQVDMIVPQESYSSYYFEDKQYSNFCCYVGNTRVTVDDCVMKQMSGTYRGANIGVLDIWSRGEEDIVIMNCDLHSNARDEQVGIFSTAKDSAYVKNVDFINNTIHAYSPKYAEVVGNTTMRFTIGYSDSKNVDDIRIAGNHFVVEADSKFMTFGAVTNCVIENNIIEVLCTYKTWSSVFDSGNSNAENVIVRNNEFFITSEQGVGKGNIVGGAGETTFENNKIFSDVTMPFAMAGNGVPLKNNQMVFLEYLATITEDTSASGNTGYFYGGLGEICRFSGTNDETKDMYFTDNVIYDYKRNYEKRSMWQALCKLGAVLKSLEFSRNSYFAPNTKFSGADNTTGETEVDEEGNLKIYNRIFYYRCADNRVIENLIYKNNTLQGAKGYVAYGDTSTTKFVDENNVCLEFTGNKQEKAAIRVELSREGKVISEISTVEDTIDLDDIVWIAQETDEEGNVTKEALATDKEIKWYTSVEAMAQVSEKGVVTRKMYGDVHVYAVPLDGSGVYGECIIHFQRENATDIKLAKESIVLQPGLKFYSDYIVLPKGQASQEVAWKSSNESVATVTEGGLIKALAVGEADITCNTLDGTNISKTIHVTVTDVTVKKINLDKKSWYFTTNQLGTQQKLAVSSYVPENAVNTQVGRWESDNPEVAEVDQNGTVTAKGGGVARIKAYATDEKCYGVCEVFVQPSKIENLQVTAITDQTISLQWDKQENCYGYYIYRWDEAQQQWVNVYGDNYLKPEVTNYKVSDLTVGTEYKFKVCSFLTNWNSGERELYESEENIITATTYTYKPITSLQSTHGRIELMKGKTGTVSIAYKPTDADYPELDINYKIQDETIARITEVTTEENKRTYTLEGLDYGITYLEVASNDEVGASLTIPIAVLHEQCVPEDSFTVQAEYGKTVLHFKGVEEEAYIDGYMIRRTQTMEFSDLKFIPKNNTGIYTFVDDTITKEAGKEYRYVVCPCITDGTTYFCGGFVADRRITTPEIVLTQQIAFSQNIYVLSPGESIEMQVDITPENVSDTRLVWTLSNKNIAALETVVKEEAGKTKSYAKLTGKSCGVGSVEAAAVDDSDYVATTKFVVKPRKVCDVRATLQSKAVALQFKAEDNVTGYFIYVYDEATKNWKKLAAVKENKYQDIGQKKEGTYRYAVSAYLEVDGICYEGTKSDSVTVKVSKTEQMKKGSKFAKGKFIYQVTSTAKGKATVTLKTYKGKAATVKIPKTVKADKVTYKVTAVSADAFKNNKTLKKLVIEVNVSSIGKKAFYGCKKLKSITIKTKKLNSKNVGSKAFKGIYKKAKIKVPKSKLKSYKKLLKSKGAGGEVKITK